MLSTKKDTSAKHVFDICGWEVWIDPLNFAIKKGKASYYYSTFMGMLMGLNDVVESKALKNSEKLDDAIERVAAEHDDLVSSLEDIIEELRPLATSVHSLGQLEWH